MSHAHHVNLVKFRFDKDLAAYGAETFWRVLHGL